MRLHPGILSQHSKFFDFVNRMGDIAILAMALAIVRCMEGAGFLWGINSTLLFLFTLTYFQLAAALSGLYASQRSYNTVQYLGHVLPALLGTFALLAMTTGLSNNLHSHFNREFLFRCFVMSALLLCGWRLLLRQILIAARKRGHNIRRVAIAGYNSTAHSLARKMQDNPWMGFNITGFYDDEPFESLPPQKTLADLVSAARNGAFDHIYITLPMSQEERITELVDALSDSTATVFIVPDIFTFELLNARQTSIDGIPAISIYDSPFSVTDTLIKRSFDIGCSIAILFVVALPMLLIAAAVKLTSPGPVIFRQRRYGLDGKPIEVWKFRSMTAMDNGSDVKQATKNDPRITPVGAFLRRTSLDELPQFINVLQGYMSIVGPRPHAVAHNEEYRKLIKGYMLRHKVKPGITGWAQINGWRGETDTLEKMEKRVEYDLDYIRNWNIWLDVKIVCLTVFCGFIGKNVY